MTVDRRRIKIARTLFVLHQRHSSDRAAGAGGGLLLRDSKTTNTRSKTIIGDYECALTVVCRLMADNQHQHTETTGSLLSSQREVSNRLQPASLVATAAVCRRTIVD